MRGVLVIFLAACGSRTELDVTASVDASVHDVTAHDAVDEAHDAGDEHEADVVEEPDASVCDYGTLGADPFGTATFWNGGAPVPAGHYRVTYVDGCMKYSSSQGWTINAYANGPDTLYVVANTTVIVAPAPGTVGFFVNQGAFASFDACVAANLAQDAPLAIDFPGGPIGLQLIDSPYTDNVPGENGRNPTYRLSSCP